MKIFIASKYFDFLYCNQYYDVSTDQLEEDAFRFRVAKLVYDKVKGWRNLGVEVRQAVRAYGAWLETEPTKREVWNYDKY